MVSSPPAARRRRAVRGDLRPGDGEPWAAPGAAGYGARGAGAGAAGPRRDRAGSWRGSPARSTRTLVEEIVLAAHGWPGEAERLATRLIEERSARRVVAAVEQAGPASQALAAAREEVAAGVRDLARVRARHGVAAAGADAVACPYKGLAPYEPSDAPLFHGREELVARLCARLVDTAFVAVVGPSGAGKSSLVRAGLLPALAAGVLPGLAEVRQHLLVPGWTAAGARPARPSSWWTSSRRSSPRSPTTSPSRPTSMTSPHSPPGRVPGSWSCCAAISWERAPRTPAWQSCSATAPCWSGRCARRRSAARSNYPPARSDCAANRRWSTRSCRTCRTRRARCR